MLLIQAEILHFGLSLLIGFFVYKKYKNFLVILLSLLGGFFIDFDHSIDYLIAFGWPIDFKNLISGASFQALDKAYLFFHGWEYVLLGLALFFIIKSSKIKLLILAFSLSLFGHLLIDWKTNNMYFKSYSVIVRFRNNFNLERLVTPEHWERHLREKKL
jgi:hypothetical protein